MRKALVLSALGLALVLPGAADAARFGGVVVAKDAKRQAVVVASPPTVRTVRAGRVFRRLRVGHRVVVSATRRPDGTYDRVALRPVGRAGSVRFAAIVVQQQAALRRLIVSSGGSVFAVGTGRSANNAAGGGLVAGDRVRVDAIVSPAGLKASEVKESGRAKLVELEGSFLNTGESGFDLAVLERGLVHVDVPEGAVLPDFEPGDQVSMVVLIGKDGSFTFIRGLDEGERDSGKKPREGELEAHGVLAVRAPFAVTVRREDGTKVECAVPAGLDLGIFRVGEHVKLHCVTREDRLVLVKLRSEYGWVMANGTGDLYVHGLLAKGEHGVSVRRSDGMDLRCAVPRELNLEPFRVGEPVKVHCHLRAEGWVLSAIRSESAELTVHGTLTDRTDASLTVRSQDGTDFTCDVPPDLDLSAFPVGTQVKLRCHRLDGKFRLGFIKSEKAVVEVPH